MPGTIKTSWNWMGKDFESLKNERGLVEGLLADLDPDRVAAPGPEAGPGPAAAPGLVAGPGLRTGPSPGTVLGPEVVLSRLTGTHPRRLVAVTKEGPGLRTGPSLETDPSLVAGPGLRTGPSLGTVLNRSLDLVLNPGMIKLKQKTSQYENYEKTFFSHYGKKKQNQFYNFFFCENFLKRSKNIYLRQHCINQERDSLGQFSWKNPTNFEIIKGNLWIF